MAPPAMLGKAISQQRDLVDIIDGTEEFPSFSQTVRMRKTFKDGELTYELVEKIMGEDITQNDAMRS